MSGFQTKLIFLFFPQITEISGEKFLTLAPKVNMQSLRKDVVDLLQAQDGKFLLVSRLSGSFRACYGRKFPLGTTRLEELIKSLEGTVTVCWTNPKS